MAGWDSFASADAEIAHLAKAHDAADAGDTVNVVCQVLRWRSAIKLCQWERLESEAGMQREYIYQIGRRYRITCATACEPKLFRKSRRLGDTLCLASIICTLASPCGKHNATHTCLDAFASNPNIALRWRKLWYALPKCDRHEKLVRHFLGNDKRT